MLRRGRGLATPAPRDASGATSTRLERATVWDPGPLGGMGGWGVDSTPTHTANTWCTAHTDTQTQLWIHTVRNAITRQPHTHTHTHQKTPDSKKHTQRRRSHTAHRSTETHAHTRTLTHTAGREAAQSCGVDGGRSGETPASAVPPASHGRGRCPAAQSQAGPAGTRPPSGRPWCSRGPALPARWPQRVPRPPASASRARPSPLPAPAPRGPGAASDPPPAAPGRTCETTNSPTCRSRRPPAHIPPSRASGPARPRRGTEGREREGAPPRQLVPGPRAPHARTHTHTHTQTHTHPAAAPSGGPGHTLNHGPGVHHTRNIPGHAASYARTHSHTHIRSRHAPTHAFPAHLAFTRTHVAPGGAHHQPQTLPHVHIAHTAHGHTRSGPFPRLHTRTRVSQAHTHRTPVPCCTCGHNPQSTPCHTQNTNAQPIRGYTTNSTPS